MDKNLFLKSILDSEPSAVVACDLNHTIIYMNPFAVNKHHKDLTGQSLLNCHNPDSKEKIEKTLEWFRKDKSNNQVLEFHNDKENRDVYMIALRDENGELIGYWEKHCYRNVDSSQRYDYK